MIDDSWRGSDVYTSTPFYVRIRLINPSHSLSQTNTVDLSRRAHYQIRYKHVITETYVQKQSISLHKTCLNVILYSTKYAAIKAGDWQHS